MIKCVTFDIEDVLYDATQQMSAARLSAVKAMIEAGLPGHVEAAYRTLEGIVSEYGLEYDNHFDKLLERLGLKWSASVVAAGVVAYRRTSPAYLKPYPDTVPSLIRLRDEKYLLGVATKGRAVKQWQKLIQLGLQHLFHAVVVSDEVSSKSVDPTVLRRLMDQLNVQPSETVYVASRLHPEISSANKVNAISVRIRRGEGRIEEPQDEEAKPKYEVSKLSEILKLVGQM